TGHSSTSISAALGIATAKKLSGEDGFVVAVIGDGAMTGGMAYEALNHAGSLKIPMIIILNDNGIAISPSVGLLSTQLNRLRVSPGYFKFKRGLKKTTRKIPFVGKSIERGFSRFKNSIKRIMVKDGMFESLGVKYMGPADGHDVEEIELLLNEAKKSKELTVIHIQTKKGKGYVHAENSPDVFHGISQFDPETGQVLDSGNKSYSKIFGETLISLAEENEKVVGITAAMPDGTGMTEFAKRFPDRFFDVGIAEQHAVTFSAGLATRGMVPIFAVYSTFLQRGYDQLLHDVALQNLHCIFAIDRAGIVGRDGETHQGVFDLSYLSHLPNFTVMAPSNGDELEKMLKFAVNELSGPVAIRYPRGEALIKKDEEEITLGRGRVLKDGTDVCLIAIGSSTEDAMIASDILEKKGISAAVIDARFLRPFDKELVGKYLETCKVVATVEENVSTGGLYSAVKEILTADVLRFSLPCESIQMGSVSEIKKKYGIDGESIAQAVMKKFDK
ncbi:MAG: 1-deoxy-D-xylulose-5-phosphate synthase, partial [Clostridia bacterium]|nr:1-deoxy-D-xylulose-5-phosphate synthase [Clostridia bacterium]